MFQIYYCKQKLHIIATVLKIHFNNYLLQKDYKSQAHGTVLFVINNGQIIRLVIYNPHNDL